MRHRYAQLARVMRIRLMMRTLYLHGGLPGECGAYVLMHTCADSR